MISQITLPWWGWGYLLVVMTLFIAGCISDEKPDWNELVSSALSLFSICIFVIGFFNAFIVDAVNYLLIPMFLIGVYWEFSRALTESRRAEEDLSNDIDLTDNERIVLLNVAIGVNALVVVPGYVMGLVLCCKLLGLA